MNTVEQLPLLDGLDLHGDSSLLLGVEGSEVASISGTAILAGSSESCAVQSHLGYPLALIVNLGGIPPMVEVLISMLRKGFSKRYS